MGTHLLAVAVAWLLIMPGSASAATIDFEDITAESGITQEATRTWGSTFVDYDLNGWPDVFVGRHLRRPFFFSNASGGFSRLLIHDLENPPPDRNYYDRHSCAWGEANADGLPDLFCVSGAQKGQGTGPNELLLQSPAGDLVDQAEVFGVRDLYGRGRSINWLDHNADRRLDAFVGNEIRDGHPNVLFRRTASGFQRTAGAIAIETATTSSTTSDYNGDHRPDLFVHAHGPDGTIVYRNDGPNFSRVWLPGISGSEWVAAAWADFDGDGRIDVVLNSFTQLRILRNTRTGFRTVFSRELSAGRNAVWLDVENDGDLDLFVVQGSMAYGGGNNLPDFFVKQTKEGFVTVKGAGFAGPRSGSGDSAAAADVDRDGRVDLLVANGYEMAEGPVELLRNQTEAGHYVLLRLDGGPNNPFGYGARVTVRTPSMRYQRQVTDGVGFRTQSEVSPVHLGLAKDTSATITVRWDDGTCDRLSLRADLLAALSKGAAPCV